MSAQVKKRQNGERPLAGRDVTLWPDNDDEGRAYAAAVARQLRAAASVRIAVSTPGTPPKWDAADALAESWDHSKAAAMIAAALPARGDGAWPSDPANDDAEIACLAKLPPRQYERERRGRSKTARLSRRDT